jgi:oligoribonuclease (3'-5' exoribonuclease)
MRYVNPALHGRLPDLAAEHRPQGDIDNSIAFWRFYIDNFFHEV